MNKKIISYIVFYFLAIFLIYYLITDHATDFEDFLGNIENRLIKFEKINFTSFLEKSNCCSFSKDSLEVNIEFSKFKKIKICNNRTKRIYQLNELPENFLKDFYEVKNICDDLNISDVHKEPVFQTIEFVFNLKHIKKSTIPVWNDEKIRRRDTHDGILIYDVNNVNEKDNYYLKIKDKWYYYHCEERLMDNCCD